MRKTSKAKFNYFFVINKAFIVVTTNLVLYIHWIKESREDRLKESIVVYGLVYFILKCPQKEFYKFWGGFIIWNLLDKNGRYANSR